MHIYHNGVCHNENTANIDNFTWKTLSAILAQSTIIAGKNNKTFYLVISVNGEYP